MALQINTAQFPQFTDLVNRVVTKAYENFPYVFRDSGLVRVEKMPENTGLFRRLYENLVTDTYAYAKPEGAPARAARVQYGYEKDLQVTRYGLDVSITREMRIANKNPEVIQRILAAAKTIPNRMELDLANRITFGTATSYVNRDGATVDITTGDAVALFSASHTLTGSATTYSNRLSGDPAFSKGSLEGMERLISENTFDNLGVKIPMPFDIIWCGDDPVTINRIMEELKATADTSSANAGTFNVNNMKYRMVKLPLIATDVNGGVDTTKRRYWGIASSEYCEMYLNVLEAPFLKAPRDGNNGEDFSTENWSYAGRGSYWISTVSARWIKWSFPTS